MRAVTLSRRKEVPSLKYLSAGLGLLLATTVLAGAAAATTRHSARGNVAAVGARPQHRRPHPRPTPGNLMVVVPPTPSHRALGKLCKQLLRGDVAAVSTDHPTGSHVNSIRALIGATGGDATKSAQWCRV